MLDYKETDPVDDVWETGSNLRNEVKIVCFLLNYLDC